MEDFFDGFTIAFTTPYNHNITKLDLCLTSMFEQIERGQLIHARTENTNVFALTVERCEHFLALNDKDQIAFDTYKTDAIAQLHADISTMDGVALVERFDAQKNKNYNFSLGFRVSCEMPPVLLAVRDEEVQRVARIMLGRIHFALSHLSPAHVVHRPPVPTPYEVPTTYLCGEGADTIHQYTYYDGLVYKTININKAELDAKNAAAYAADLDAYNTYVPQVRVDIPMSRNKEKKLLMFNNGAGMSAIRAAFMRIPGAISVTARNDNGLRYLRCAVALPADAPEPL